MNIAFIGSKEAGFIALREVYKAAPESLKLILCPDDMDDSRNVHSAFQQFSNDNKLLMSLTDSSSDINQILISHHIDIAIVVGWYKIINVKLVPNCKFYGIHYSLLPKYRGNAPLVWQILNGEEDLGISLFEITIGMDEGDIIGQQCFKLNADENIKTALGRAQEASVLLLQENLAKLITRQEPRIIQDHTQATYCGLRIPDDGRIDWNLSALDIHNFIRAQSPPYPGAFTFLNGEKILILEASPDPRIIYSVPGSIVERHDNYIVIGCGECAIQVHTISINGDSTISPRFVFKSLKNRLN